MTPTVTHLAPRFVAAVVPAVLLVTAGNAFGAPPEPMDPPALSSPAGSPSDLRTEHRVDLLPEHRFQWAPSDAKNVQVAVNFGLLQLALGGFNVAAEVRYRRLSAPGRRRHRGPTTGRS